MPLYCNCIHTLTVFMLSSVVFVVFCGAMTPTCQICKKKKKNRHQVISVFVRAPSGGEAVNCSSRSFISTLRKHKCLMTMLQSKHGFLTVSGHTLHLYLIYLNTKLEVLKHQEFLHSSLTFLTDWYQAVNNLTHKCLFPMDSLLNVCT